MQVSVRPNTSTNASTPNRSLKPSRMLEAVGAAKMQRRRLSASSGRGGCCHTKSIITPTKLVTVAPLSRTCLAQALALNRSCSTYRAPAISAGYAARKWLLPWNSGPADMYTSASVSRVSETHWSAKRCMWACGIMTPFDRPVVPEVKKTDPRSEWRTGGRSTGPPAGASSSNSSQPETAKPASRRVADATARSSAVPPARKKRSTVRTDSALSAKRSA